MIIVKLISGLGNQLFQYAVGRQLAINNNTRLKLDISFYSGQKLRSYQLKHFCIKADIAASTEVVQLLRINPERSVIVKIYHRIQRYILQRNKFHYKEKNWWQYDSQLLSTSGDVYLEGYWQAWPYFKMLDRQIIQELQLKNPAECDAYPIFSKVANDDSSVAIHIRRGDYITDADANKLMGVLPLKYYEDAIAYIGERLKAPSFYIFSDDLTWAADHLHINAPVTLVDINKDYLELDLMSRCRHQIIANSSFSWWGAFLNQNPDKIVIAPQNWVKLPEINAGIDLAFPNWIKL